MNADACYVVKYFWSQQNIFMSMKRQSEDLQLLWSIVAPYQVISYFLYFETQKSNIYEDH